MVSDKGKLERKINFRNVGKMNQYEVDLFSIMERPFDFEDAFNNAGKQSYAEEQLSHFHSQIKDYLKGKGYECFRGKFQIVEGQIVECKQGNELFSKWLFEAIQERDQALGQTGEYLAALIEHWCWRLECEWQMKWWEKSPPPFGFILDTAILIQQFFFQLKLLEMQKYYSSGLKTHQSCKVKSAKLRKGGRNAFLNAVKKIMKRYKQDDKTFKECMESIKNKSSEKLTIVEQADKKYVVTHEDFDGQLVVEYRTLEGWFTKCDK